MLLFKLILFIGVFLAIIYGVELCMPPFGQLYYTNPLEILVSLSQTLSYKLKISKDISMVVTILIVGILPLFITIMTGRITNKKKKKFKYRFK
ncbi:hypothetical protein [Fusobacterium necrogenes]|uniref:hypothetical protein n=1 Tax=Fusobacterium necrogenes TaxID=858 RepID=UPI00255C2F4A|nr:hypothetical protein [Fusobacterium necrogenes]